jgi:hypothetical protein
MSSQSLFLRLCTLFVLTILLYFINGHRLSLMTESDRTFAYNQKVEHLTLISNNVVLNNESPIIDYNTYRNLTILPPLFHQIWIKSVGGRRLPDSQINSCRVFHNNSNAKLLGDKMYKVQWQHKLWNNTDLEDFFMFNSTSKKALIFSNSSLDNKTPRHHLKQFVTKHFLIFRSTSKKGEGSYRPRNVSQEEEEVYDKLADIIYSRFQLNRSTEYPLEDDPNQMNFLLKLTDLFRIFILLIFGGIYVDADSYCMKSFTPLLSIPHYSYIINSKTITNQVYNNSKEVYLNFASFENENERGKLIANGVLASTSNSETLFRLISDYLVVEPHYSAYTNVDTPAWLSSGPTLLTNYIDLLSMQNTNSYFRLYPSHLFYPIHYTDTQIINSFQQNIAMMLHYIRTNHPDSFTIQLFGSTIDII